jgi:UPF0755 protein
VVVASIVVLAIVIIGVTTGVILHYLNSSQDETPRTVVFVIQQEESVDSISERLHDAGLIRSPAYFRIRVRLTDQAEEIYAGRYELNTAMTTSSIIDTITNRDSALAPERLVRFIEGWRTEQFAEALLAEGLIESTDEFMIATRDPKWNEKFTFLHSRPSGVALEGYLFPDSYNFRTDATVDEIIETLLTTFQERAAPDLLARADELNLTLHQVVTIASIVEREAVLADERPVIASVYANRLAQGMPLQADPTVQYQLGTPAEWWPTLSSDQLQHNGPYNTYLNNGLPPGPICNPSVAALEAALNPEDTNYLFFVAKGDGSHAFATTFEEHQANIDQYQQPQ